MQKKNFSRRKIKILNYNYVKGVILMLEYFMGIGGLAVGFIIGMLYSDYQHKKQK